MTYDPEAEDRLYADAERILLDAAHALEQRGWCQRRLEDEDGHLCTLGAVNHVTDVVNGWVLTEAIAGHEAGTAIHQAAIQGWGTRQEVLNNPARRLALALIFDAIGGYAYIEEWNDDPDRTAEDVLLTLKHAADAAHHRADPSRDASYRYLRGLA